MRSIAVTALALLLSSGLGLAQGTVPASPPGAAKPAEQGAKKDTLAIGDKAPTLTIEKWVKGQPVKGFEKGKLYVVEFWATWCPPCRASIPHMTEMQKKYKDVTFIGISSMERNGLSDVEPFVKKMGDKMDYNVAYDKDHQTGKAWMEAAGQDGIPTAFVVDRDQRIAWIGHPMVGLEEVVEQEVAGKYDVEKAAAKAKHDTELQSKLKDIMGKMQEAMEASPADYAKASSLLDDAIALNPPDFQLAQLAVAKIRILGIAMKEPEKAYAYANQALATSLKNNAQALNEVAWTFLDDKAFADKRDPVTAKKLAERANELTKGQNPEILDTLAAACMQTGEADRAVELQTKAVELAPAGKEKDQLQQRLDEYTKKVKKS